MKKLRAPLLARRLLARVMARRRLRAADKLGVFLRSASRVGRVGAIVRRFRWRVVVVQRMWRSYAACHQARLSALSSLWERSARQLGCVDQNEAGSQQPTVTETATKQPAGRGDRRKPVVTAAGAG